MTAHKKAAGEGVPQAACKNLEHQHFTATGIECQFQDAARAAGIPLTGAIIADGVLHRSHIEGQRARLSDADRAAIAAERQRREIERQQTQRTAAEKARFIWAKTQHITDPSQHPYLMKKRIQANGARLSVYQGRASLVIPILGESGLTSLQFIEADGSKRFLPGGEIKGCSVGIGMSGVTQAEPGGF